jgi:hypothetical protein
MDLMNNNDLLKDGQSISKSDVLSPSDALLSEEELELKEKLKKIEGREVTRDDMMKIIQDTHQILNEEIMTLRNELEKKFETTTVRMNRYVPNTDFESLLKD